MSGFFGDLSPSQEEALKEMKDTFGDIDDHTALRFLRARQFMVKNAAALYKKYVEYRKESGIEKILRTEVPKTDLFKSFVPHAYHGFDKDGRPIYFEKTGLIDYPTAFRFLDEEDFMRHHLYQMEYQIERCKEGSQMVGKVVDNFCSVVDLTSLNMSHRKALKLIRMWAAHDQDCYPERLGRLYIINAPWIFPTFWKICKIWLDQNTINKIKVLGRNYKSELREVIAEHYIPHEYGGTCKCPGGCVAVADISMHKDGASLEEELKDLPEKTISSRECFEVRLQCGPEGGEFQWAFRVAGDKDLSFSVQCESGMLEWSYSSSSLHNLNAAESEKKATDTKKKEVKPRYIVEPERLNSTKGSYVSKGPATIVVKFDNSSSYFTSKTLKFFARVGAPSEDISEEKMAALALTEQENIAQEQQQANVDDAPTSSDVPASLHASITAQSPVAEPVNVQ